MAGTPTVYFKVTGRQPEESEVRELSAMQMSGKKPSKEEVKDATKWFAVGVLAGPVLALIGYLILSAKKLAGIGKLVFGLGGMFAGVVMVIFGFASLFKMFRSAQKKTPGKSANWFWVTSVMGDDVSSGDKFGKIDYAIATMARMLPADMPFSEKDETLWLIDFRKALADAADEAGKPIRAAGNLTQSPPQVSLRVDEEKEISPGLAQVSASLTFHDMFSYASGNSQTNKVLAATLQIGISQYYIRNGQVWFPYDLAPAYERLDTPPKESDSPSVT